MGKRVQQNAIFLLGGAVFEAALVCSRFWGFWEDLGDSTFYIGGGGERSLTIPTLTVRSGSS